MAFLSNRPAGPSDTSATMSTVTPTISFEEFLALDEVQATEVASATAAAILRAAQARHDELLAAATAAVDQAQARADAN